MRSACPSFPGVFKSPAFDAPTPFGARRPIRDRRKSPSASPFGWRRRPNLPESEKNRLLASAILGSPVPSKPARISRRRTRLTRRARSFGNMESTKANIGSSAPVRRPGLEIKDWGEANWIAALARLRRKPRFRLSFLATRRRPPRSTGYGAACRELASFQSGRTTTLDPDHAWDHRAFRWLCRTRLRSDAFGGRL